MTPDQPLFSPQRLLRAFRYFWFLEVVCHIDVPFWKVMKYHGRPYQSHLDGWY